MRTYAFETKFAREAAGGFYHPDRGGSVRSFGDVVAIGASTGLALSRGSIPFPATGQAVVHATLSGQLVGGDGSVSVLTFRGANHAFVDGVNAAASLQTIQRCGIGSFFGAGRLGGGDFVMFSGALETAVDVGADPVASLDGILGTGETSGAGFSPAGYNASIQPLWSGHWGFCEFFEDDAELNPLGLTDDLWNIIVNREGNWTLPNGEVLTDCVFAGVCPTATVYLASQDYGSSGANGVPNDVTQNTRDRFNNHPAVFYRKKGTKMLRSIMQRVRDSSDIITEEVFQPIGIYSQVGARDTSTWLMSFDGVPEVVTLTHEGIVGDTRRPKDIWNKIIAPLCATKQSNSRRVKAYTTNNVEIGTCARWKYLDAARFLGERGDQEQANVVSPD